VETVGSSFPDRAQDTARHVLSVLVPDLEHAGFHGFARAHSVQVVGALPGGIHDCGTDFAIRLAVPVQGSNNTFRLGDDATDCDPTASAGGAREGTDTLTVRHASQETAAAHPGRLQLYSQSLASAAPLRLFADGRAPGPLDLAHEVRDVEIRRYYIANNSVERPGWPALRVKALTEAGGAAQFRDEEVMPGVEDLQVEFGVEDSAGLTRYRPPDLATLRGQHVVAVRLWLRIRADTTERGFADPRELRYADVEFVPDTVEATRRRLLIEHTIALRNPRWCSNQPLPCACAAACSFWAC
jgi:hypothetical protein